MSQNRRETTLLARLLAGLTAFSIVLAGAAWATAQSDNSPREKLKQKMAEKNKQPRDAKPDPQNKPQTARPVSRTSDAANPLAAAIKPSEIDATLEQELRKAGRELSPIAKDQDFLRRVYFDLTGKPPAPDKLDEFVNDTDPAKRSKVIDALLGTDDYARNWARYWRDVILYHSLDPRARIAAGKGEAWLTEQIKANVHWDKIATELITATGEVAEEGRTILLFSQWDGTQENMPVNLAAETTRVFMGIQIACAQCHDHPYDEWKREQFHEMAAFFARTLVKRDPSNPGKFEIASKDEVASERFKALKGSPKGAMEKLSPQKQAEIKAKLPQKIAAKKGEPFSLEHRMPDKEDPENSTLVHPQFLLGQTTAQGLSDAERRVQFASFVTDRNNPWFARAYVNRIWGELMGEGFYEPVDDLGPGREARFPMIINRLASAWRASDYDVKWLFRLIMNTDAYQREIRPTDPSAEKSPFAAVCPTRLSADQIFDALAATVGIADNAGPLGPMPGPQLRRGPVGVRGQITQAFGVDPSTPSDEVQGTIPQALFMINSPVLANQIRGQGDTLLGRLLSVYDNDEELIRLLYKRILARIPTDTEMKTCQEYIKEVNDRREAFEDLLWSLVNSTEFITKR